MMRSLRLIPLAILCCLVIPGAAMSQDPTGACYGLGEVDAICIDGLTESECSSMADFEPSGWEISRACEEVELPFQWDGSCLLDLLFYDDACVLVWTAPGGSYTSQYHCEELDNGVWSDTLSCEVPVPTMPRSALAIMACLILGAALLVMAARGRSLRA